MSIKRSKALTHDMTPTAILWFCWLNTGRFLLLSSRSRYQGFRVLAKSGQNLQLSYRGGSPLNNTKHSVQCNTRTEKYFPLKSMSMIWRYAWTTKANIRNIPLWILTKYNFEINGHILADLMLCRDVKLDTVKYWEKHQLYYHASHPTTRLYFTL